ncbi:Rix1 protein [Martiniozyma asiatica (nom. inval.)]|nr:Rix1 protein [Martiniozyma asiatica]
MNVLLNSVSDLNAPIALLVGLMNADVIKNSTQVEQTNLLVKICTLMKSNHARLRWRGLRLWQLSIRHPVLLLNTSHQSNLLAACVKILESKCFIGENPGQEELVCLNAAVDTVDFVMDKIRGKQGLVREVLTPKLPGIISSLIGLVGVVNVVGVLYKLLLSNSNTFRPFGSKFEKKLLIILANGDNFKKLESETLRDVLKCLSLLSFNLARNDIEEQWSKRMNALMLEIMSVVGIYNSLLDTESNPTYVTKVKTLPQSNENLRPDYLFGTLDLDINEDPYSVLKISDRIQILLMMIQAQLESSTPNVVQVPFGQLISLGTLLSSLGTYGNIKSDIRGDDLHNSIGDSLLLIQSTALNFLNNLIKKFSAAIYPHVFEILATMDSIVPVYARNGKLKVDKKKIWDQKDVVGSNVEVITSILNLVERWKDMSVLTRIVDSCECLLEGSSAPDPTGGANAITGATGGKKKKKGTIALSDYLSNPKAFSEELSPRLIGLIRNFYICLVKKCELSTGKLNVIVRWAILDAVSSKSLNEQQRNLMRAIVLYPGKSKGAVSAYPIIVGLLENDDVLSLMMNPRFPLLPQLVAYTGKEYNESASEQDDDHDDELNETENKNGKEANNDEIERSEINALKRKHQEEEKIEEIAKKAKIETEYSDMIVKESDEQIKNILPQSITTEPNTQAAAPIQEVSEEQAEESDSDVDSDFEIPEINVD